MNQNTASDKNKCVLGNIGAASVWDWLMLMNGPYVVCKVHATYALIVIVKMSCIQLLQMEHIASHRNIETPELHALLCCPHPFYMKIDEF